MNWNEFENYAKSDKNPNKKAFLESEQYINILTECINKRHALNLSQEEVAVSAGLKQSAVARFESMKATPNLNTLISILVALDCTLEVKSNYTTIELKRQNYDFNAKSKKIKITDVSDNFPLVACTVEA